MPLWQISQLVNAVSSQLRLLSLVWGISVHSSLQKAFSSVRYLGLFQDLSTDFWWRLCYDCDVHVKTFWLCFLRKTFVDFELCLGLLSCCRIYPLFIFSFFTDGLMFAFRMRRYLTESILPPISEMSVTQVQSRIDPPLNSWSSVLFMKHCALFPPNIPLLIIAKVLHLNSTIPQDKGIRLV